MGRPSLHRYICAYLDGAVSTGKIYRLKRPGRHSNGDGIVQIVDGTATLHVVTVDGSRSFGLKVGMVAIVPRGAWHRCERRRVSLMTATPKPTEHLSVAVADPRTLE